MCRFVEGGNVQLAELVMMVSSKQQSFMFKITLWGVFLQISGLVFMSLQQPP